MKDRYEPMPSLAALPAWLWRRAPRSARLAVAGLAVVGAAGLAAMLVHGAGVRDGERRETAAFRTRAEARLRADQAPRHGRAPTARALPAALERAIGRDVVRRRLGPGMPVTSCRRVRPVDAAGTPLALPATDAYFTCFAVLRTGETGAATLQTGYGFRARANLATHAFAWCKLNPRPIHADQEEFIRVALSRECVPPES